MCNQIKMYRISISRTQFLLIAILICVVLFIYIQHAFEVHPSFEMIQTDLSEFNGDMLFAKCPIILNDKIVEPMSLCDTIFKYMYVNKSKQEFAASSSEARELRVNRCLFVVLYGDQTSDFIVTIQHPVKATSIDCKLAYHQCLILPIRWRFSSNVPLKAISLDSSLTLIGKWFMM